MIERLRRCHLQPLGGAGSNTMTIIATQPRVLVVLRMTEANAESRSHFSRTDVTP
jgi:hypothetical protein